MLRSASKAQAEFNWILILVAGIIILSSFAAFAIDYKSLSDRRINTELSLAISQHLDSLTSPSLTTAINPEGLNFFSSRFSCNSLILNDGSPISIEDKIIFSSSNILSDKLLLWVDEFSLPYRIANVYYISSPYTKYYILHDESTRELASAIFSYIPLTQDGKRFFNVKLIDSLSAESIENDIKKESLREVRIVTFDDISLPSLSLKTRVIKITKDLNNGLAYYQDENQEVKYIKKQLLLASIFSDNYDCNFNKLISRMDNLNKIHEDKAARLFFKTQAENQKCNYQLLRSSIASIKKEDFNNLINIEQKLALQNLELNKKGCQDVF